MFKIAKWYNNFQSPAVLMIDDLSDAYVDVYPQSYKNDWGYLCSSSGSSFDFLNKELLLNFPQIKVTFFVPYLRHNVINPKSKYEYKKFALGEREEYTVFLKYLVEKGHEIAHHGSNHGEYTDDNIPSTLNNWTHEWALFKDVNTGVSVTLSGVQKFKEICNIEVVGGKYCGYVAIENSEEIIDKCNFLYWCDKPSYSIREFDEGFFGQQNTISFPTNFAGNAFVRLTYLSGDKQRDKKKKLVKYFQPLYNIYSYIQLYKLYKKRQIISIQEHNSPSTSAGTVQSANIVTDIKSLNKIFAFLRPLSIWYATCREISEYIYIREHSTIKQKGDVLHIYYKNRNKRDSNIVSIIREKAFAIKNDNRMFVSSVNNHQHVVNIPLVNGNNDFAIVES